MTSVGTLYIVSTPIGNLEDITLRALRVLKEVDLIAAEDTRHTRKLLAAYDIHTALTSYFEHNKAQKSTYLIQQLLKGKSIALVSDAGTPGISDPGYQVIVAALEHDVTVMPVPGPSAMLAALTVSGLPLNTFLFIGFLTNKRSARRKQLQGYKQELQTLVCYVSPHHFLNAMQDIYDVLGNRQIAVTRELTKTFEEVVRGPVSEVIDTFRQRPSIKGEFTVVIAGANAYEKPSLSPEQIVQELKKRIDIQGLSRKDAVKAVAQEYGLAKNMVYQCTVALKQENESL